MSAAALAPGRVAVITGAASGIGLAAAKRFASLGMKVCLTDISADQLNHAGTQVAKLAQHGDTDVLTCVTDIAQIEQMHALRQQVYGKFGEVGLLMNNAVTRVGGGPLENYANWQQAMEVNFWGVVNGVQAFVPAMIAQHTPCMVVNCGSKQGITNPPGNTAYNVTKAALKTYTEGLQHELRNRQDCQVSAHLLVPGWTTTGKREHQPGAWLPDQVVDYLLTALARHDFYIVCPDNEVSPAMDRKRILWAAGDIVENRPPLSRWHPAFKEPFEKFSD